VASAGDRPRTKHDPNGDTWKSDVDMNDSDIDTERSGVDTEKSDTDTEASDGRIRRIRRTYQT
jgi:hypothetical protein